MNQKNNYMKQKMNQKIKMTVIQIIKKALIKV